MLKDPHVFELLPAYALDSLDEEETRLVADHVAECYLCRKELSTFQHVTDQLALAVPDAHPSDSLKVRLMERIDGLKPEQPVQAAGWNFPKRLLPVGLFASLALILLLALSNFLLWQRMNNLEVLTGPLGMRAIALQNTAAARDASGFVIMGADGRNGVLVVDKLPPLDPAREYQVWLMRDNRYTDSAVFGVDEDGYRGVRLTAPDSLLSYSAVQVTIEPAGGSADPTGQAVLQGSLFNP